MQQSINKLPEIKRGDVEIIYENDMQDGPTEGLCKWQNKYCYFIWSGQMDKQADVIVRSFLMILLTAEQLVEEKNSMSVSLSCRIVIKIMPTVYLEDEKGTRIDKVLDLNHSVFKITEDVDLSGFSCWKYVDPHADTVFNQMQKEDLLNESVELQKRINDPKISEFLSNLIALIKKSKSEYHTYIRFFGD